jgi:hypothetical protein
LDVSYYPWVDYFPNYGDTSCVGFPTGTNPSWMWWQYPPLNWPPVGDPTFANDWNSWTNPYFANIKQMLVNQGNNCQWIIPNPGTMNTGWYEDTYLVNTDGVFLEGFMNNVAPSDFDMVCNRTLKYATGKSTNKILMVQPAIPSNIEGALGREYIMGCYLVLRNSISYFNYPFGNINWYPEYEINLGSYLMEPPDYVDTTIRTNNGVYFRYYADGLVVVNPTSSSQTFDLGENQYYHIQFSGGGQVNSTGGKAPQTLCYNCGSIMTGNVTLASQTALILYALSPFESSTATPSSTTSQSSHASGASALSSFFMPQTWLFAYVTILFVHWILCHEHH